MARRARCLVRHSFSAPPRARLRRATALPLIVSLGLLAACAQKGDFGRPKPGVWNDLIDTTGTIVASERGGPASFAPLTDDERDLRGRAWRFLMPADTEEAFLDILANLTRARVLPPAWRDPAPGRYYDSLVGPDFRSPVSRYRKLTDDAVADARLIPPFAALAARVADADAKRLRSLPFARTLDDDTVRQAAMRVAENRCLVAWVRLETGTRLAGYRFALEHLFAEAPDPARSRPTGPSRCSPPAVRCSTRCCRPMRRSAAASSRPRSPPWRSRRWL